jgi:uncharacterized protein (DUF4415 family)/uncharacterized DUF497 family protein
VSDFDRPDQEKDRFNIAQHGMSLNEAERFDFDTAEIEEDARARYGEQRFRGIGRLHNGPIVGFRFHLSWREGACDLASKGDSQEKTQMARKKLSDYLATTNSPEMTDEELARLRRAREVLPPELFARLTKRKPGQRGPGKKATKVQTSIRLDPLVINVFKRNNEKNWQKDINEVLLRAAKRRRTARQNAATPKTAAKA